MSKTQTCCESADQCDGPLSCSVLNRTGVKEYSTTNGKAQLKDRTHWNDWKWQMANRICNLDQLVNYFPQLKNQAVLARVIKIVKNTMAHLQTSTSSNRHAGLVADCRGSISYSQHDSASRIHSAIFPGFPFDFAQGGEPVEPRLLSSFGGLAGMTVELGSLLRGK